jgi:hypothetical protein
MVGGWSVLMTTRKRCGGRIRNPQVTPRSAGGIEPAARGKGVQWGDLLIAFWRAIRHLLRQRWSRQPRRGIVGRVGRASTLCQWIQPLRQPGKG